MTKLPFVTISAISFLFGSLLLSACGSADQMPTGDEEGVWPQPKPENAKLLSVPESDGATEENQCLGPNRCTSSPANCCSQSAWYIGVKGCFYGCCLRNGSGTAGGEQCCSGRARYSGSSLVCY
jgi:hypothetical protein